MLPLIRQNMYNDEIIDEDFYDMFQGFYGQITHSA
jgi:hypothetical protein